MLSAAESKLLHALQRRKARETQGFFLAEGIRVVEELAAAAYDLRFAVCATSLEDSERGKKLIQLLSQRGPVHRVADHELRKLAATEHPQGVLAVARVPSAALADLTVSDRAVVLIADAVQDPGNLGTLIRIADAFAAAAVIALPGTVDMWNAKTVRASAGSLFHLPAIAATPDELGDWLDAQSFLVIGAAADAASVEDAELPARIALVVGNEGAGLTAAGRALAKQLVSVSMPGRTESLNVAVASGILMYVIARR